MAAIRIETEKYEVIVKDLEKTGYPVLSVRKWAPHENYQMMNFNQKGVIRSRMVAVARVELGKAPIESVKLLEAFFHHKLDDLDQFFC